MNWSALDAMTLPEQVDHLKWMVEEMTEGRGDDDLTFLPPIPRRIVRALLAAEGRTVSSWACCVAVYGGERGDDFPDNSTLRVHVYNARRRLRAAGYPLEIEAVTGAGYRAKTLEARP